METGDCGQQHEKGNELGSHFCIVTHPVLSAIIQSSPGRFRAGWFNASVGVGGRGVVPTRDDDVFGAGYFYTDLDPDRFAIGGSLDDSEQGFEVFYNASIMPATRLTFDLQYFDSPLPDTDDSILLALRLQADL